MKGLREFFENKSVALVGPASYLQILEPESENLKKIESCDVVVKMNRGFDLTEVYGNLISNRVDFMYNSLLENCVNGGVLDVEKIANSGILHIRTTPKSNMKGISHGYETNITKQSTFEKLSFLKNSCGIETSIIDPAFFNTMSLHIDCKPTTGFAAIFDILQFNPRLLYITGFSFFLGGPLKGYWGGSSKGGIEEEWGHSEEVHADKVFNSTRHVHKNMWRVVKETCTSMNNVEFDPIMEKIISLENYSKDGYNKIVSEYENEKLKRSS